MILGLSRKKTHFVLTFNTKILKKSFLYCRINTIRDTEVVTYYQNIHKWQLCNFHAFYIRNMYFSI